jgi:hypothetical protein
VIAGWEWTAWALLAVAVLPGLVLVMVFRRAHGGGTGGSGGSRGDRGSWNDGGGPATADDDAPALAGATDPGGLTATDAADDSDGDGFAPVTVEH